MKSIFVPFESELLESGSFHPDEDRIRLKFKSNGQSYDYMPNPLNPPENMQVLWISLVSASSQGTYFLRNMRYNKQLITRKVMAEKPTSQIQEELQLGHEG